MIPVEIDDRFNELHPLFVIAGFCTACSERLTPRPSPRAMPAKKPMAGPVERRSPYRDD